MSDQKLYLFKVVRRGYDPDEVLFCFQKMIRIFGGRITKYDSLVKQWGEEAHRLKVKAGEDRKWIEELEKQNMRLLEENRSLRHRLGLPPEEEPARTGAGRAESVWPPRRTPNS